MQTRKFTDLFTEKVYRKKGSKFIKNCVQYIEYDIFCYLTDDA